MIFIGRAADRHRASARSSAHFVRLSLFSGYWTDFWAACSVCCAAWSWSALFVILCHALRLDGEPWWRESMLVPYAEHAANVLRGMVGERKIT